VNGAAGTSDGPVVFVRKAGDGVTRTLSGTAIVVVVTLGLAACSGGEDASTDGPGWTRLAPQELDDLLRSEDVYLVNVHVPYEGEIVGTDALIPFTDLASRMSELPAEGGPTLVLYCRSGNMSTEAAQDLVDAGRTGFFELEGGFNAWVDSGMPFDAPDR